jgi:hypothetical protein
VPRLFHTATGPHRGLRQPSEPRVAEGLNNPLLRPVGGAAVAARRIPVNEERGTAGPRPRYLEDPSALAVSDSRQRKQSVRASVRAVGPPLRRLLGISGGGGETRRSHPIFVGGNAPNAECQNQAQRLVTGAAFWIAPSSVAALEPVYWGTRYTCVRRGLVRNPKLARISDLRYNATLEEIAQEKAASLGLAGRRLQEALVRYREEACGACADEALKSFRDEAAEALYFYVVQREACGLHDTAEIFRELRVPREIQIWMGVRQSAGQ